MHDRPRATGSLMLDPNIADPDGFYQELLQAYDGLSPEDCEGFSARLILVLANQIGDREILRQALRAAR
jgi:hypothetical protein